jgi:hypothetical protein
MTEPAHRFMKVEEGGLEPFNERLALGLALGIGRGVLDPAVDIAGSRILIPHETGIKGQGASRPGGDRRVNPLAGRPVTLEPAPEVIERFIVGKDIRKRRRKATGKNPEGG